MKINFVSAVLGTIVIVAGGFIVYDTATNGEVAIPSSVWYSVGGVLALIGLGLTFGVIKTPKVS